MLKSVPPASPLTLTRGFTVGRGEKGEEICTTLQFCRCVCGGGSGCAVSIQSRTTVQTTSCTLWKRKLITGPPGKTSDITVACFTGNRPNNNFSSLRTSRQKMILTTDLQEQKLSLCAPRKGNNHQLARLPTVPAAIRHFL